jgi:hypothetical protein
VKMNKGDDAVNRMATLFGGIHKGAGVVHTVKLHPNDFCRLQSASIPALQLHDRKWYLWGAEVTTDSKSTQGYAQLNGGPEQAI